MKIKALFVSAMIFTVCLFVVGCKSSAEELSYNVAQMVKYAKNSDYARANTLFQDFSPEEAVELGTYLEKNPTKLPPIYFIIAADKVFELDKDKAVFYYNLGKARAIEDVSMCQDKTASGQLSMYSMVAPKTVRYMVSRGLDYDYINGIFEKVSSWDLNNDRMSPKWACYHGIQSFSGEPKLLPASEFPKIQKETHKVMKNAAKIIVQYNKHNKQQINNMK